MFNCQNTCNFTLRFLSCIVSNFTGALTLYLKYYTLPIILYE